MSCFFLIGLVLLTEFVYYCIFYYARSIHFSTVNPPNAKAKTSRKFSSRISSHILTVTSPDSNGRKSNTKIPRTLRLCKLCPLKWIQQLELSVDKVLSSVPFPSPTILCEMFMLTLKDLFQPRSRQALDRVRFSLPVRVRHSSQAQATGTGDEAFRRRTT